MNSPVFSIIMPAFNASKTIAESIDSVLLQDYCNFELIVIDDCSCDDTVNILDVFAAGDPRVKVLSTEVNKGVASARNLGIQVSSGRFICFLDADDLWLSNKLSAQLSAFQAGALVVCAAYYRFGDGVEMKLVKVPGEISYQRILYGNCIPNLTGAYDSQVLGKFFQKSIGHEDYLMWIDILAVAGWAKGISSPLGYYRVSSNTLSSNKFRALRWTWNIYFNELRFGFLKSFFCFSLSAFFSVLKRIS